MAAPTTQNQLYYFFNVIFKRKIALLVTLLVCLIALIGGTYLMAPVYQATTKILVRHNPRQQIMMFRDIHVPDVFSAPKVNLASNMVQMAQSRNIAEIIVRKYHLDERLRQKKEDPQELRDIIWRYLKKTVKSPYAAVRWVGEELGLWQKGKKNYVVLAIDELLGDSLDIQLESDTEVIDLSIWDEDPVMGFNIANTMAAILIERVRSLDQDEASSAYEFAREQLQPAEGDLHDAEEALLKFKERVGVAEAGEEKKKKLEELYRQKGILAELERELAGVEASIRELDNQLAKQKEEISSSKITGVNPVTLDLKKSLHASEIQLAEDLSKYTDEHLELQKQRSRVTENQEKLKQEKEEIRLSETVSLNPIWQDLSGRKAFLEVQRKSHLDKKRALEGQIRSMDAEIASLLEKQITIDRLERSRKINEDLVMTLRNKLSELQVQKVARMSEYDLKILDEAHILPNSGTNWPWWDIHLLVGIPLALVISLMFPFLLEYWDDSFHAAWEVEELLRLPVLTTISEFKLG